MIVAITGGTGFIGTRLVLRHLSQGDVVRVLTRRNTIDIETSQDLHLIHGDLTNDFEKMIPFVGGVDVLYHCAGEIRERKKMYSVHVTGTENLCAAANGRIGHWVQLSSVGVYGAYSSGIVTEQSPLHPMGTYEKTKTVSDQVVINAAKADAFTYSILRPSNIFGPTMTNRSLFQLIKMIQKGLFFFIGKPGASANYIHVDNVVEGLIKCGELPNARGRIYNLSDYQTIEEFVTIIADELRKPVPKLRLPEMLVKWMAKLCGRLPHFPLTEGRVKGLTSRAVYSIERIQQELGYVHQFPMEDGLREMVKTWKQSK